MFVDGAVQQASLAMSRLDVPTLSFVAVCIAAMLGLFLIFAWLQERNVRALAWWGSAYLIGAASLALWSAPTHLFAVPPELAAALIFIACGMIWNGVRLFRHRRQLTLANFAGAAIWLVASQLPGFTEQSNARIAVGVLVVAGYTFCTAFELWRERRRSLYSKTAAVVVPSLHAGIFLMPLVMRVFMPDALARSWLLVFTLETIIYAIGTAFIMLLMVKDHYVHVYRTAANTDPLTGLLNRRAFAESARSLCAHEARRGKAISLLMFDLDHFKSINDRFGHAVGDDVLRVFAQVTGASLRASDVVARLGGEEFAAILPADRDAAAMIGERVRAAFEAAAITVSGFDLKATVSIGAAVSEGPVTDLDALMEEADAALYQAKSGGRNRLELAGGRQVSEAVRLIDAARAARRETVAERLQRKSAA